MLTSRNTTSVTLQCDFSISDTMYRCYNTEYFVNYVRLHYFLTYYVDDFGSCNRECLIFRIFIRFPTHDQMHNLKPALRKSNHSCFYLEWKLVRTYYWYGTGYKTTFLLPTTIMMFCNLEHDTIGGE